MKPEAIQQAAVELITHIQSTHRPASEEINAYVRTRRYIGSKDRRSLTDLVWSFIRHTARLDYLYPNADIATKLAALPTVPDQIPGAPFPVNAEVPEWLVPLVPNAKTELPPLLNTPDIILRANGHRDKIQALLAQEGIETKPTPLSPFGLVLTKRTNLSVSATYRNGLIEVQDEGSQCVALETGIRAGNTVLDYCAGAGGKSLIFAQMMHNVGTIIAHDISDRSLRELSRRAERAGASCIQVQKPVRKKLFDHVVVDAPCSGTGTWRRCPDARWKLSFDQLSRLTQTQASILDTAVPFVKDGGYLSYMTCSLTYPENEGQADAFLTRHPDFKCVKQKQFSPAQTNTDGLFIAVFQKNG